MNRDAFDALVRQLEVRAGQDPARFTVRVGALAAFGYAYMLGVLALTTALTLAIVVLALRFPNGATIKLGLAGVVLFGGMAWAILRSLWVRLEKPRGFVIRPADAPALFKVIDEVRQSLGAPLFHEVQLDTDYNAAVVQVPRLGMFGWHRNYLLIGLPLMQGLGPEEFRAVLAHEFGHLSGGHGRFSNWLYRLRRTWEQVVAELARQQRGKLAFLVTKFIGWYWPRFNAHAFVLSRVNEYEADAASARLTGPVHAATALQRVRVHSIALDEHFWPAVFRRANTEPEPPKDVFLASDAALRNGLSASETARWIRASFLADTTNADTHPCLRDRLRALGALPEGIEAGRFPETLPPTPPVSAAQALLGAQLERITRNVGEHWAGLIAPGWKERHAHALQVAAELGKLPPIEATTTPVGGDPDVVETLWKKAAALLDLEGDAAVQPILDRILAAKPDHAGACFVQGRHLLALDDPRGVEMVERAMKAEASLVRDGCNLLYGHYTRTGQKEKLRPLENRVDASGEEEAAANRERADIRPADTFLPHGLDEAQLKALRDLLAREPDIREAWVVQKQVKHFPENPCRIIALKLGVSFFSFRSSSASQKLVDRLLPKFDFPGHTLLFCDENNLKGLAKAIRKVPGSQVYARVKR